MQKDKTHIILDFDSTLIPTHLAVLDLYRELTNDYSTTVNDRTLTWSMTKVCPLWTAEEVNAVFSHPKLFEHMYKYVAQSTLDILRALKNLGYTIEICTIHRKSGVRLKKEFLNEIYGDIVDKITIIETSDTDPIKMDKSMIVGNIIIDDNIDNLLSSPAPIKICFGHYTWNKEWSGVRVNDFDEVFNYLSRKELIWEIF